ncbi:MFS transporter [Pseudonocardia phyllosphaerae]|uniref:MFS transporter n=1 Tax=Pseudonocardia phyllosphaerae TaxID=3390502 RepID=UPI003979A7AA
MAVDEPGHRAVQRRRMLLVAAVLLVAANLRASLTGVGPLLDVITADVHLSAVAAGALTALPLLAFAAVSPLVPRAASLFGGAENALVLALCVLIVGIGVRWLPSAAALFVGTSVIGVGIAVGNVLLPSVIKRHFPDSVGVMTSAYATVMSAVAAVVSGVVVPISTRLPGGWRSALGVWIVPAVAAAAIWGWRLLGRRRGNLGTAPRSGGSRLPWSSGTAWAVTAFMGLQSLGFYVVITWLPSVVQDDAGFSADQAGVLLFVFQIVAVAVSLVVPVLLRTIADQRILAVAGSVLSLAGYSGLLTAPALAVLWVVVLGVGGGACLVLALMFLSVRAADPAAAGALSAMAQSMGYLLAAIGPVGFGAFHVGNTWAAALTALAVVAVLQIAVAGFAGRGTVVVR